jgi:glucan phosphoethanolaminetransferase (alkaline phosphatase superfamily)
MDSGRRSGNFRGVKITLIVFQTLAIIGAVALTIVDVIAIGVVNSDPDSVKPDDPSHVSKYLNPTYFYISILFEFFLKSLLILNNLNLTSHLLIIFIETLLIVGVVLGVLTLLLSNYSQQMHHFID